jgi:hypothetical protein
MVKGTCLAAPQRKIGTPQRLDPKSLRWMASAQRYLTQGKHNQSINATNMYIMNAKCESNLESFGARITEFGVVVGEIWVFEVFGGYFVNFLVLWTFLDFVFILQGPDCEIFGLQVNF